MNIVIKPSGRRSQVVGWGVTGFPIGKPRPVLQKLEVNTMSNYQCSHIIEGPVSLGMLWASPHSMQGTCFVSCFNIISSYDEILALE